MAEVVIGVCDYEGLISGSCKSHDRCTLEASWAVHLGCGHVEMYCGPHREEFATLLHTAAVVCTCGFETHNSKIRWRKLRPAKG